MVRSGPSVPPALTGPVHLNLENRSVLSHLTQLSVRSDSISKMVGPSDRTEPALTIPGLSSRVANLQSTPNVLPASTAATGCVRFKERLVRIVRLLLKR